MHQYDNKEFYEMALKIRAKTGKSVRCCYFCVRYARGNFQKALELCSESPAEDGRRF